MIYLLMLFFAVSGLLTLGNILIRIKNAPGIQLFYNCLLLSLLLFLSLMLLYSNTRSTELNLISINPFSLFFIMLLTLGMLLVNLVASLSAKNYGDFALLSSFALLGMYLVSSSLSLIGILIGLELVSLPSVFIILLEKRTLEAAAKLFIMASIAIAIFSFATVFVYGATSSFSLSQFSQSGVMLFASILFIASIGFDASIFPFNVLIPDVYEGSPAYITSMLGGVNKKVGFAALLQILILIFVSYKTTFMAVALLSMLTMFYGNIVAIMQENIKRMMAYSSISQAGYILIGIAVGNGNGISASLVQIFAHMFLFIGLLSVIAWLERKNRVSIDEYIGLNDENRFASVAMTLFMLSLIGMPFTTGFVGKLLLFVSAVGANLTWLAIAGIVNSIISIFYYARVIMAIYTSKAGSKKIELNKEVLVVVCICLALTLVMGIYPNVLINMSNNAAEYLLGR